MNGTRTEPADACHDYIAAQWEAARDEAADLGNRGSNWDGQGALPVRPGLIEATLRLLQSLEPFNSAPADVYLASDGTVVLEWYFAQGRATIVNVREVDHAEVIIRTPGEPPQFTTLPIPSTVGTSMTDMRPPDEPISYFDDGAYELAA
jgi:hypothetical protein